MVRLSVLALALVTAVFATASVATAATGTGRFTVAPSTPPEAAHLHFWLAPGYEQLVGALGGNPLMGAFRRGPAQVSGNDCVDELNAAGRARRSPPVRHGNLVRLVKGQDTGHGTRSKYLRVLSSGRSGGLHWYIGLTWSWPRTSPSTKDPGLAAVAVFRAPSRFVSPATPWAVVTIGQTSSCRNSRAAHIVELRRAIRSTFLMPGPVHRAPGVPIAAA